MPEVNRRLAHRISALGTVYPPTVPDADPLVGRRMPDVGLKAVDSAATRVYELLHQGRFVLLSPAGDQGPKAAVDSGYADRVTAVSVDTYDEHAELDGVREVLVRPDGHVAWATRTGDADERGDERARALTAWAGTPA